MLGRRRRAHGRVFPRDAFEEVTDPTLLLLLRVGQKKELFGSRHVIIHLARHDNVLLLVQVIFVALDVAATALQGGRRFEDVPQGACAGLTAGGEVIQGEDELVALVVDVGRAVAVRRRLHYHLLFALTLALVVVQDLEYPRYFLGVGAVHVGLSDRSGVKQLIYVQGHEGVGLLSVLLTVVEQDFPTAHHYILLVPAEPLCILGRK